MKFTIPKFKKDDIVTMIDEKGQRKVGYIRAVSLRSGENPDIYYAVSPIDVAVSDGENYKVVKEDELFVSRYKWDMPMYQIGEIVTARTNMGDGTKLRNMFEIKKVECSLELIEDTGEVVSIIKYYEDSMDRNSFWCYEHEILELEVENAAETA